MRPAVLGDANLLGVALVWMTPPADVDHAPRPRPTRRWADRARATEPSDGGLTGGVRRRSLTGTVHRPVRPFRRAPGASAEGISAGSEIYKRGAQPPFRVDRTEGEAPRGAWAWTWSGGDTVGGGGRLRSQVVGGVGAGRSGEGVRCPDPLKQNVAGAGLAWSTCDPKYKLK